jgi:hypothetical protein
MSLEMVIFCFELSAKTKATLIKPGVVGKISLSIGACVETAYD